MEKAYSQWKCGDCGTWMYQGTEHDDPPSEWRVGKEPADWLPITRTVPGPELSIGGAIADAGYGVRFTIFINSGASKWVYRGLVTASALALIGGSEPFKSSFERIKGKIGLRALDQWSAQPSDSFEYVVDSENYQDGGGFVNNG